MNIQNQFTLDKQKELEALVEEAFAGELEKQNNFILLSNVGFKLSAKMQELGFGKATKKTFQKAPACFGIEKNDKGYEGIVLLKYKTGETGKQSDSLPPERQKELEALVEKFFLSEIKAKQYSFNLTSIGQRIGARAKLLGFDKVNQTLFEKAPECFAVEKKGKGTATIHLLKYSRMDEIWKNKDMDFLEKVQTGLLKVYTTLDVSLESVQSFFIQSRIIVPAEYKDVQDVMDALCQRYGEIIRDNGEGTPVEKFLRLRTPDPIPEETYAMVRSLAQQYFQDGEVVKNTIINQALINNGIHFKEYNYPNLTSFLRAFSEVFTIVPKVNPKDKQGDIYIRVNNGIRAAVSEDESTQSEENDIPLQDLFRKLTEEKQFDVMIKPGYLKTVRAMCDADLWQYIINAQYHLLNPEGEDYILSEAQRQLFTDAPKDTNLSLLGLRLEAFGEEGRTPAYCLYHIGLTWGVKNDKALCCRNLLLYCLRYEEEKFAPLWEQYKDTHINKAMMLPIIVYLYCNHQLDRLIYMVETRPERVTNYDEVFVYYEYALILQQKGGKLISPAVLSTEENIYEAVSILLDGLKVQGRTEEYFHILKCCLENPEEWLSRMSLDEYLSQNHEYIFENWTVLTESAVKELGDWQFAEYVVQHHGNDEDKEKWQQFAQMYKEELTQRIAQAASEEELQELQRRAMSFFPRDEEFTMSSYEEVKQQVETATTAQLKQICAKLAEENNYALLVRIYEDGLIKQQEPWLYQWLSDGYKALGNMDVAIQAKYNEVVARGKKNASMQQLVSLLNDEILSMHLPEVEKAQLYFDVLKEYTFDKGEIEAYATVMLGLSYVTGRDGLVCLLYALFRGTKEHPFYKDLEEKYMARELGYSIRWNDMVRIYEYMLTTESWPVIEEYVHVAAKVLKSEEVDRNYYTRLKDMLAKDVDGKVFTKLMIADFDDDKAWKALSKYSNECNKYNLNYAANLLWVLKFREIGYALTNLTRAVDDWVDDTLPRNFLINNLYLIKRQDQQFAGYMDRFLAHIVRGWSFWKVDQQVLTQYLQKLTQGPGMSNFESELLILVLAQSGKYEYLFQSEYANLEVFESQLLSNPKNLIRFLAMFVCDCDQFRYEKEYALVQELYSKGSQLNVSNMERSAMLWIDRLFVMRKEGRVDENFFSTSKLILESFPKEPSERTINNKILNVRTGAGAQLIEQWVNTYDNISVASKAYSYMLRKTAAQDQEEILAEYKLLLVLLRKVMVYYEGRGSEVFDYLRSCKSYLAVRYILGENQEDSSKFMQRMEQNLKRDKYYDSFKEYETALHKVAACKMDQDLKNELIYCGITNYWDVFLEKVRTNPQLLQDVTEPLQEYMSVVDHRPFRRRIMQLYLYMRVAYLELDVKNGSVNVREVEKNKESLRSGAVDYEQYMASVRHLTKELLPQLDALIEKWETQPIQKQLIYAKALYFVLWNKKWKDLGQNIDQMDSMQLDEVVIPCSVMIRYPWELNRIMTIWAYQPNSVVMQYLDHQVVWDMIGEFNAHYVAAVYWLKNKNYDEAEKFVAAMDENCPAAFREKVEKLKQVLTYQTEIEWYGWNNDDVSIPAFPTFSFMQRVDPKGAAFSRLISEFNSKDNLYDAGQKCEMAGQIYHYLLNGASYDVGIAFFFEWGFYAIEREYDIEQKSSILYELLDNVYRLPDKNLYKKQFVNLFVYILNEYEFNLFVNNSEDIMKYYKRLYATYAPFDDYLCYAELLAAMSKINGLLRGNIDTVKVLPEMEKIKEKIMTVNEHYPNNTFADKCISFVEQYIHQVYERGVFEVRILNENQYFDGTVYYQIKNIGFETVSEITLTAYLDGYQAISRVKIADGGLRPGQIYAGEYVTNVELAEDSEVVCVLRLEYNDKNYIAVDRTNGGTLRVKKSNYEYRKSSYSGYIQRTIEAEEKRSFIGRAQEIDEIVGSLIKRENVVLYGTNGTGKSSILNNLSEVHIPEVCRNLDKVPVIIPIVADNECTERQVIYGILDKICSENCMLLQTLKYDYPDRDFTCIYNSVQDAIHRRQQLEIVAENGIVSSNVVELFSIISNGLKRAGVVLFFLWDNFEKVVSSPNVDPKHMTFLRTMGEVPNAASSIRFVFSGSNYLLEAVSIKQGNDSWNEILSRCSTAIKIGNLCYEDFTALMCQKRALNDGQIHYCPEAVEYLWKYTNGHAFYSCLLGNRTLDILSRRRVKRDCIYPSDVYIAIYKSQEYMANDTLDTSKENAIEKQIFQDIADNIAVKYVGKTLAQRIIKGAESMSHKKLQDMVTRKRPDISDKNFGMALEILQARDFVHKVNGKGVAYAFTSDLYLERFSSIEVHELTVQEVESIEQKKKDIYDFMRDMSMDEIERLRKLMGNQFSSAGDTTFVATGATNIGTQNNVQINNLKIDQISNSVQGLVELAKKKRFQAAEVEELIEVLPRLELRPSEDVDEQVDEMAKFDTDVYCENLEKGVEKSDVSLEQWVQGEGQAFLMNQGVDVDRLKALGRGYYNSVIVAMYLRDLFGKIQMFSRTVHLDFAPVTILLCKAVERMLTEKHLPLYQDPEIWVNKVRANTPESGTPQQRIVFSKSTIGTFTTAMQAMFDIPEGDSEKQAKEENRDRFLARTRATEQEWKVYLMDLIEAKDIRNMTAHANPVSQQDCDKIITKLFPLELLDHTVDYVE